MSKQQDFTSSITFSNDTTSFASSTESYTNHEYQHINITCIIHIFIIQNDEILPYPNMPLGNL